MRSQSGLGGEDAYSIDAVGDHGRNVSSSVPERLMDLRDSVSPTTSALTDPTHSRETFLAQHAQDLSRLNGGFTLIELLIVIVVLGILAAVVIFALGGITGKSAVAACQADGATVSTAISALNAQYPNVLTGLPSVETALLTQTASDGGPYLSSWPSNPGHYTYSMLSGQLAILVPGPTSGTWTPTSFNTTAGTIATGAYSGMASSLYGVATTGALLGAPYAGPGSCVGVK